MIGGSERPAHLPHTGRGATDDSAGGNFPFARGVRIL
jgi:hypothetical protein